MALTLETRQNNKNTAGTSVSAVSGNNNGGLLGGSAYLNEKMALGFLSSVEGIWDYTAGGIAKLFGADQWAERQFANDWVNYNHADEWYDPGKGWQIAGDVAGGIGTSLPAIAAAGGAAALTVATGGAAAPAAVKILSVSVAPLVSGLGAAGNATKSAYQKTGELGLKEFGYGALSGATEAGVEALTAGIGTGTGRIVSSLSKKAAGETVSTLGKSGAFALLNKLGADFASEAIEEGLAEAVDPLYQRWTKVDPNAQNASAKEIGYAALVGGLSGIVMSGGAAAVNTTANLFSGDSSIKSGTSGAILDTARQISDFESANNTGYKSFQSIRDAYSQLSASLTGTGGQVSTVKQKMLLGSLKQAETAAFVEPFIERSAMSLLTSSESAAERFSALGMTDANGKPLTFTAEQIRSGVDADLITKLSTGKLTDTERRTLTKQVRKAIGTNSVLTTLAVMDATGRISMDAEKFAQAALSGRQIATAADLNRFIETASPAQIENLSKKLKIDNWAALTPDVFQSRVAEFNATEEGQAYRAQMEFVKQAQTIADSESKKLPRLFRSNTVAQGLTHYASADGRVNMALLREGDRYHIYDYETGNPSRDLTLAEVNSAIRPYWNAQGNAQSTAQTAQDAQKPVAVQTDGSSTETPTESATAAQTVRLNMIAAENITDWRGMSEPNRAAVRMTMRQALAAGMDEDTALTFGRVAARSGMNIVFSAEQSGDGDARITGNTIYIDPNADKGRMENKLLLHEAGHALMREAKGVRLIARAFETVEPDRSSQIAQKYQKFYQQLGMRMDQYLPIIDEEIAAAGIEDVLGDVNAWEYILSEEPSFGDKILNFFRKSAQDYSSSAGLSKEARKLLNTYKKMFAELSERNRGNNAITLANEAKMAGDINDSRFSLKYADTIAYNQRITAKNRSFITMEELDKAIADTDRMVGVMKPHEKILPKDKEGKTLVKNGSYDVSVENTTVCIRTLSYNAFVDMVSEKIHRPLSQMESFLVSQKLYDIAKEPQCLYCYVSLDRKAYNEMLLRYLKQRDDAVAAYEAAGRPEITRSSELYEKFRNTPTKRKDTDEMWDRYRSWIDAVNRGEHLLTADEIATETRREELAKKGGSEAAQVKDMLKYAQSASWANKQTQYAAYFGDILRLSPRVVNNLNRHYGLRWYSFSDYSGAFIVENMQQITDASIRGLKGLSYTKDTDFAEIFAPTGMNINISVYAKRVGDHYEIDPKQSADLQEAIALRKKYPNVGIVAVATDQAGVEWALAQEWSDVVIPFHTVRTGAQVAEFYDWTVFNEEQNDSVKDENLWKAYVDDVAAGKSESAKKKVSKMVYPSEHQNNREKYLKLIEERGLKPRFSSFLDNPNYMKLVNETRQSEAQTSALKPVYDLDAAERSFAKFVEKGGYYEGWYNDGIDVDAEAEIVAQDIRSGKKANEVEYGRQDVDYEQIAKGRKSQRAHGERFALPENDIIDLNEDEYLKSAVNGIYGSQKYKIIADYIYERLGNKNVVLSDGRSAIVDKRDASHIAKESADKKTAQISKIDEIVKKAQPYAYAGNVEHPKFDYFYYYKANVRYGEDVFPIYLNVGRAINDGKWHIYDLTNKIRDTADRINGLERPKPNEGYALTNGISEDRIAQTKPKVNSKSKKSSDERLALPEDSKYLDAVNRGDMETAQRMVDEAAKEAGYTPVKRYHQTGHKFTRFSNENPDAGLNDSDTPNGYFFKDNDHDIGVGADFVKTGHGGSIQMEVYLNDSNLLYFENRDAAQKWYSKHVPEYAKILQEYNNHIEEYKRIDKENTAKMFEELNALVEKGEDTAENELAVMDKYDKIIDGWIAEKEEYETSLRAQMRKLLNTYFIESDSGYNGIELADDGHRYIDGKREDVHTYIVFNNTQIKSAAPVTYDDNGNVIPLSQRFQKNNLDIRYALPEDGEKKKKYHKSPGQVRASVANSIHKKAYSKADAREALKDLTGTSMLTKKTQEELADYLWQGFNACETEAERKKFAESFSMAVMEKLLDLEADAPDAQMYEDRADQLHSGIGRLMLANTPYEGDLRHILDKDGYRRFLARWGFKQNSGGKRPYAADQFVNDIAGEVPWMEHLREMHTAGALIEIDRMYTEAFLKAGEIINPFDDLSANEREAMVFGFEKQILQAFEQRGKQSVFAREVGYVVGNYAQMAQRARAEYDEINGRNKILNMIDAQAKKMKDLKLGTFANATQMESDVFKGSIQKLASIEYRGNLSVTKAKNALRELSAWYTQEQKPLMYVDEQNPGYYNKGVAEMLRALTETDDPFTKDQLAMLQDVMSYFVKFVENYGKVWRGGKWIDAKPEAERYVAQIVKNADIKTTTFDRMMRTRYINSFGDPHAVVKQYDGYDDGFCTEMFEEIRKAALDADVQLMNVMSDYDAFMEKNPKYMKQAAKQQIRWVEDGRTNTMPKMVAIGLYMTSKREHAQAGLALNGFKFKDSDGNIIRAGAIIRNADPKEVTQAQIGEAITDLQSRIRKQLSAEDLEYIKILEKGYGYDLRALKAERDMARQGFTNVTTGYYYPIRRADIAKSIDVSVFSELDRVSNASFNKSIVEGARGKLFIEDADALFHRHAVAVTRYSSLSPVIESFNILFNMDTSGNPNNSVSVATTIEVQWPKAKEYFRDLIADVQGVPKNTGEYSKDLSKMRGRIAMAQLGANPKTWVTQFSSLFAASSMLDPTSITKGLAHASDDVDNYCDLAKLRNYEGASIKAQGVLDKVSSVGELLMKPIAATDCLVVKCLWGACQVQVQKDSKLKIGTEENKIAAGKMLTEVLFETQQNSLATERSAMMRSGNELIRALTMFSADGMKVTGRFLDGIGEVSVLKRRLETANADEKPAIEKKLKTAKKRSRKATAAMVSSAVFSVMIAEAFRWLYAKEREEDEDALLDMTLDFVGNLLGGLPGLRDVYSFFIDGYELDNYAISAVNDLLTSVKSTTTLAWDLMRGEGDPKDIPAKVKNLAYAAGQLYGIPVRNIYNVLTGLTRRISPNAGYWVDNVFYKKNYRTDLKKAIEEGDMRRVSLLMGLINGKDESGLIGDEGMSELSRLAASGASVLPRTIGKTVSINGEEVELDTSQVQMINEAYSESWSSSMASLLASSAYASMSDAQKEKAIRMVHDISYERALVSAGIDRGEKSVLIADLIGIESAAVYYSLTSGIVSDVDKNGKTVEGSKRAKVVSAIRSMNLGRERTLLMICLAGYSLKDGDVRGMKAKSEKVLLLKYIMQLPGKSAAQKAVIAQACGFEVKNGRVMMSSLNGD